MPNTINVVWQSYRPTTPNRHYWDTAMIEAIFANELWQPVCGHEFIHRDGFRELPEDADGAVVCFPAQWQSEHLDKLNADLAKLRWVVLVLFADEEAAFPSHLVKHPNMRLWIQTPIPGKHNFANHFLPVGYPTGAPKMIGQFGELAKNREYDWFFSGQVTHQRRQECIAQLRRMLSEKSYLNETLGFTKGMAREEYYGLMCKSKIAPSPSGPCTPDSFRLAEALEAGCIPIADGLSPITPRGYWEYIFGEVPPFPVLEDWNALPHVTQALLADWPANANVVSSWWMKYKRRLTYDMRDDINAVQRYSIETPDASRRDELVTIVIPTSPIPSHPDTSIIEAVITSIRYHFPKAELILMIDGVRPQMEHRRSQYEEYVRLLIWKCEHDWKNILPVVFKKPSQQAIMMRTILGMVKTPFIFFVEHDAPIVMDRPIDWDAIMQVLQSGDANMVRLYYFEQILNEHKYLMRDMVNWHGARFVKTIQYSQWPNIGTVEFYKRILTDHFGLDQLAMIETVMYSPVVENAWEKFKVVIYHPDGNTQRFTHLNGRQGDPGEW